MWYRQKQFLASSFFVTTRFCRPNKGGPRWQVGPLWGVAGWVCFFSGENCFQFSQLL
jgi:hypothetical protein